MAPRRAVWWLLGSGLAASGLLAAVALSSPFWLRPIVEKQASVMLARPVAIGSLELQRPAIRVIATEDGRGNYADLIAPVQGGTFESLVGALTILDGHARVSLAGLRAEFDVAFGTEQGNGSTRRIIAEGH